MSDQTSGETPAIHMTSIDERALADKMTSFLYWTEDKERLKRFIDDCATGMESCDPYEMLRVASLLQQVVIAIAENAKQEAENGVETHWEKIDRQNDRVILNHAKRYIANGERSLKRFKTI